jgi:hypothetical protein
MYYSKRALISTLYVRAKILAIYPVDERFGMRFARRLSEHDIGVIKVDHGIARGQSGLIMPPWKQTSVRFD